MARGQYSAGRPGPAMRNDRTPQTVLGTLVDRAVCMPYAKPQVLRHGFRRHRDEDTGKWRSVAPISEDAAAAAEFLVTILTAPGADSRWSKAELTLDPGGPWWAKPRDDFFQLDDDARKWVLNRLEDTAVRAAECLENEAVDRGWAWLWSQPPLASPGKVRPSITQPDLIGGLDWKRCDIIDLKTTGKDDLRSAAKSGQTQVFGSWVASLRKMGFTPERCSVLVVSTTENRYDWIGFPVTDATAGPALLATS